MIRLLWPWLLVLAPLPWLLRRLLPPAGGRIPALYVPAALALPRDASLPAARSRGRAAPLALALVWLLVLAAAARPQWLGEPVEIPESGRSVMLAVDISGSMETPDLDYHGSRADRLTVVKEVAGEFLRRRVGDRVGLILFGTRAYVQAPLTLDRITTATLLWEARIGMAGKKTAIGDAIGLAIKRLRRAGQEKKAVLILLTDGANTAGRVPPRRAAELAAQAGLRIHTIGVGATEVKVRTPFGTRRVNPSRDLDEDTLRHIARVTGGEYFRATDRDSLERIYQRIDQLEPVEAGSRTVRPVSELFVWPLAAALLLSMGWAALALAVHPGGRARREEAA